MGANAQTSVPAFTAGQVLTAQQQTEINTGVPVFADATARDAAFGGSGEKVLAEGQLAYLEDSKIVQYYDGATWATVGPAPSGAFVFIAAGSFSTVTSVSLPNSTFTSTYRNYKLIFDLTATSSTSTITGRLRASGTDESGSTYGNISVGIQSDNNASSVGNASQTSFNLGFSNGGTYSLSLDIVRPQVSHRTIIMGHLVGVNSDANFFVGRSVQGVLANTTSYDSFSVISNVASSMTGVYRVYGYGDS